MTTLIDGAKYRGTDPNQPPAVWCGGMETFVDLEGNRLPDFIPGQLDEESPMGRYFVHRYDVVRVKVAVEARSQSEAMIKADDYLEQSHPLADVYHSVGDDEKIAKHYGFPTWIHYEKADESTYYLVDEFGDEDFNRSQEYDDAQNLLMPTWAEHHEYPLEDWHYAVTNGDTRLGYEAWIGQQKEAA